ncbi:hypothetical protein [Chelativorans xinjiangense]|uniref:hypothetical protein n=1 Tax=Chelativorans xinjiangense TaxID=2681485 RepID=UPI00135A34C9|nr:hypothetical protein [Chelativorans xinjiangense]
MNQTTLKAVLEQAEHWAEEDRQDLADYARVIEARRTGTYRVSETEREALTKSLKEADRGEFATDAMISAAAKRFDR